MPHPRLIVVARDREPDPDRFEKAVREIAATHVLFTTEGAPTELAAAVEPGIEPDLPAVEADAESLTVTESGPTDGKVYFARRGLILVSGKEPFLIAPRAPLERAADATALLGEANMGVAAAIRLPGPTEVLSDPPEARLCPGPAPHWPVVRQSNPVCPIHRIYLG